MAFQYYLGGKRQRNECQIPIISQDEDMIIASPATKRMRPCHDDCEMTLSPSVVSVAVSDYSVASSMETSSATAPWWKQASEKQKNPSLALLGEHDLACHVCESVYTANTTETSSTSKDVMPANSLLAYFSCESSKASNAFTTKKLPMKSHVPEYSSLTCTFCERGACSKCLASCEECRKPFCTFCLTNDYCGTYARLVCLDCSPEELESQDDSMAL